MVHNYYQLPGGEDTVVANEKKMLKAHGHRIFFYQRNNAELETMNVVQKLFVPFHMVFNLRTYKDVRKIIREEKIDIVHVHNTMILISPAVYYAAASCGVPVVQTVHNFRLLCPGAVFYRDGKICEKCVQKGLLWAIKYKCYRESRIQTLACVMNMSFHRMTGIYKRINYICLTEFNKNKILRFKQIGKEMVFVKPNFVESSETIIEGSKRKNQIVFAGRLEKLKGIDLLLNAWKKMGIQAPELIVCGTGPLEEWCRNFVRENKMKTVKMMGFVPNNETRKLIGESKALILPTQCYEGFPMSMIEAFSTGTPVLCSDLGNGGSIVTNGVNGIKFVPDCPEEIIKAVINIESYKNIYETTYQVYLEKYTIQKNYEKLMDIYKDITEKNKGSFE